MAVYIGLYTFGVHSVDSKTPNYFSVYISPPIVGTPLSSGLPCIRVPETLAEQEAKFPASAGALQILQLRMPRSSGGPPLEDAEGLP